MIWEHSYLIMCSKRGSKIRDFSWSGIAFRIGFWAFVFNYMFTFWFRIGGIFDGLGLVWRSDFEHSYLITCSTFGSELAVFLMIWNRFWNRILSIRIELHVQNVVQNSGSFWWSGTGFGIGFWAFVLNYMYKTGFRICGLCDGLEPVLESGFEHSYLIMSSKRGSKITVF